MEKGDERTFAIVGSAMEVHRRLGPGFLEAVYQEALAIEFAERSIPFRRELELLVLYKGRLLQTSYRADFVCYETVLVELKAIAHLGAIEEAQIINYLKVTHLEVALLLNFATPSLDYRRFVLCQSAKSA